MNEIERIASYIRSCRDANIDCTVTIDKSKTHIILNALEKQIPKTNCKIKKKFHILIIWEDYFVFCWDV